MEVYQYPSASHFLKLLKDIYKYRSFCFYLSLKWVRIKYEESYLGLFWVIINPLFIGSFYALVFGWVFGTSTNQYPYFLIVYNGIIIWQFFRDCVLEIGDSFLREPSVLKRANFPKFIIPISVLFVKFLEFSVSMIVFLIMYSFYGNLLEINWYLLALTIFSLVLFTTGIGLILSPVFVIYRDVKHAVRFIIPYLLYTLPVLFVNNKIPFKLSAYWEFNPIAYQIQLFRHLFFQESIELYHIIIHVLVCLLIFIIGMISFVKLEKKMIDLI